jgi:hypothetical protein
VNCPNEGPNKDANDLIVDWKAEGISPEEQSERLGLLLQHAKPFVVCMAERVAEMDGPARDLGMREVSGLAAQMDGHEQAIYKEQICEVLHIGRREFKELVKASIKGETDEEDKSEPIETAGGWIRGHLVELLYDRQTMKTSFVVRYPDGKIEARHNIIIEGKKYIPIYPDSLLTRDVVLLPTRLEALRPTVELVGIIRAHLNRYFDFGSDEFFERLCAYYVMFSWVYDGFTTVPYIRALGDTGTGKSRLLDTVGNVCYRPIRITGGSSASSIFRTLDLYHGTLVLDEADFAKSDEATTIAKVLNGGNQKNRPLLRMMEAGNGKWSVQAFDVYGPKVIGTRKGFGDRAIESRCLTKETGGGVPHPRIPLELPRVFWQQAEEIRNLLLAYRMATAQEQREVDYSGVDRSVEPRLNQVTLALVTIIEDEELRTEIRGFIKDYNEQLKVERSGTMTARVLEALVQCWGRGTTTASEEINRIYLKDLAEATNEIVDEQNRQMGDEVETATVDEEGRKKKSSRMTSRRVSDTVRKYLQLKVLRATDGEKGRKGTNYVVWDQERVDALCERFGVEMVGRGSLKKQMAFGEEERGKWKALDEKNKQETMEMRSGNE